MWFQTVVVKSSENYVRWNQSLPLKKRPAAAQKHQPHLLVFLCHCWNFSSGFVGFPACLHRLHCWVPVLYDPVNMVHINRQDDGNDIFRNVSWGTCEQFYFSPQIVRYAEQRIPTLSEYCVVCDEKHVFQNGPVLKVDNKIKSDVGLVVDRRK